MRASRRASSASSSADQPASASAAAVDRGRPQPAVRVAPLGGDRHDDRTTVGPVGAAGDVAGVLAAPAAPGWPASPTMPARRATDDTRCGPPRSSTPRMPMPGAETSTPACAARRRAARDARPDAADLPHRPLDLLQCLGAPHGRESYRQRLADQRTKIPNIVLYHRTTSRRTQGDAHGTARQPRRGRHRRRRRHRRRASPAGSPRRARAS